MMNWLLVGLSVHESRFLYNNTTCDLNKSCVTVMEFNICRATTGKGCPAACQEDKESLADFSSNFTLFLDASLIIFSPHAR